MKLLSIDLYEQFPCALEDQVSVQNIFHMTHTYALFDSNKLTNV